MKSQAVILSIVFFISISAFSFQKIEDPKTIEEAIAEIKVIFKELGYPLKSFLAYNIHLQTKDSQRVRKEKSLFRHLSIFQKSSNIIAISQM
jgi:hypothetical protein